MAKTRLALLGCGNLGRIVAEETLRLLPDEYEFIGVTDPNVDVRNTLADLTGAKSCESLAEMIELKPDYIIEAAAPIVLKNSAEAILGAGIDMITLSVGAFADDDFRESIGAYAKAHGAKIHLASGAIGGLDIMRAAAMNGELHSKIINIKHPSALPAEYDCGGERKLIFEGNAKEAIDKFPKNVNVAVSTALASTGTKNTVVEIISDPDMELNLHRVELDGVFGKATIEIASAPAAGNKASSSIAAYSVVAKLYEFASPISFC